jgi:hypothetical protein
MAPASVREGSGNVEPRRRPVRAFLAAPCGLDCRDMFDDIKGQLTTLTGKLTHLRRFL